MLICPKCNEMLIKQNHQFRCENGHCYDIAKRGYVNLLLGNLKHTGDDKAMVKARTKFLEKGYYRCLLNELLEIISSLKLHKIIDAGCGQGYYTNAIARLANMELYGFDLSKYAIDEACKAGTHVQYGVANSFHLPLLHTCTDAILSVFAPFDIREFSRVLKMHGYIIQVGPGKRHLYEMKQLLYKDVYENDISEAIPEGFQLILNHAIQETIQLEAKEDIQALFQMTPYFWKTSKEASVKLMQMEQLTTTIQFQITVLQKISDE